MGRSGLGRGESGMAMGREDGLEEEVLLVVLLLLLIDSGWRVLVLGEDGGYLFVDWKSFQVAILSWM